MLARSLHGYTTGKQLMLALQSLRFLLMHGKLTQAQTFSRKTPCRPYGLFRKKLL